MDLSLSPVKNMHTSTPKVQTAFNLDFTDLASIEKVAESLSKSKLKRLSICNFQPCFIVYNANFHHVFHILTQSMGTLEHLKISSRTLSWSDKNALPKLLEVIVKMRRLKSLDLKDLNGVSDDDNSDNQVLLDACKVILQDLSPSVTQIDFPMVMPMTKTSRLFKHQKATSVMDWTLMRRFENLQRLSAPVSSKLWRKVLPKLTKLKFLRLYVNPNSSFDIKSKPPIKQLAELEIIFIKSSPSRFKFSRKKCPKVIKKSLKKDNYMTYNLILQLKKLICNSVESQDDDMGIQMKSDEDGKVLKIRFQKNEEQREPERRIKRGLKIFYKQFENCASDTLLSLYL